MAANGRYYGACAGNATYPSQVIAWNNNDTVLWTANPLGSVNGNNSTAFYATPVLNANGSVIYLVSQNGYVVALNTSNGSEVFNKPISSLPIRATPALNADETRLFVHGTDGYLYSIKTSDGTAERAMPTGNGLPPTSFLHSEPMSSGPVVAADGRVYVGTSEGMVKGFNPATGLETLSLDLRTILTYQGLSIEASPAIGTNGWLYVGTRATFGNPAKLVAIDPTAASGFQVKFSVSISTDDLATAGVITQPIIDRNGFVYVTDWGHRIEQWDAVKSSAVGARPTRVWAQRSSVPDPILGDTKTCLLGKLCQTPVLSEDGLLLFGTSSYSVEGGPPTLGAAKFLAVRTYGGVIASDTGLSAGSGIGDEPLWSYSLDEAANAPMVLGTPVIRSSNGRVYFADTLGRVMRINRAGGPLMEGQWPALGGGNRHSGKSLAYAWTVLELIPPNQNNFTPSVGTAVAIDPAGRALGDAFGMFSSTQQTSQSPTFWDPISAIRMPYPGPVTNATLTSGNSQGTFVGYLAKNGKLLPKVWPFAAYTTSAAVAEQALPFPAGCDSAFPAYIAENGKVVGYGIFGTATRLVRWQLDETVSPAVWNVSSLVSPPSGGDTYTYSGGVSGFAVGKVKFVSSQPFRAFIVDPIQSSWSTINDLGTLADNPTPNTTMASEALEIREDLGICGASQNASGVWRAFFVPINGKITTANALPGLVASSGTWISRATGLNRAGIAVGMSQTNLTSTTFENRAVMWNGVGGGTVTVTDLNSIVPSTSRKLTDAVGISDNGFILCNGISNPGTTGQKAALYLLCPTRSVN